MDAVDRAVVEGHLDMALRHLETLEAVLVPAVVDALDARGRAVLDGGAAQAGALIDRIVRVVAGQDLVRQLSRLAEASDT